MIGKLRKKLVLAAMASLLAVLLVRTIVLRSKPEESPKEVDNVIAFPKGHDAFKHLHSSGKS